MENFSVLWGVLQLLVAVVFMLIIFFQHKQISNLIDAVTAINNSPATLSAIEGATKNVPPETFQQILSLLATLKVFAPTPDLQNLDDVISKFIQNIDNQKSTAGSPPVGSVGGSMSPPVPPTAPTNPLAATPGEG
jgi:predicted PurR-regulated permease PerM